MRKYLICLYTFIFATALSFNKVALAAMTFDLGEIVVTASRLAQNQYKVSSNVSVLDRNDIEASEAQTINELLQQELGINVYDNSSSKTAVVDIRGFGDTASRNVLFLVNDRKVNAIDVSAPDTLQISLDSVERIEIIRGAGSVLYGDNAVGGVVNIITKKGDGKLSGSLSGTYGSYKASSYATQVSGSHKDFSYYVFAKQDSTNGYRVNSDVHTSDYSGRFSYNFSDKLDVDLNLGWHQDHYGLPDGLTIAELKKFGRKGSTAKDDFANTKDRFLQLSFDLTPWPEDVNLGSFALDLSYRNRDTFGVISSFNFGTTRNIDSYGLNAKYMFDQQLFNRDFNFVVGLDVLDTDNRIVGRGSNSDQLMITKQELGAYLFAEYEVWPKLYANAGTRFQQANYTFDQVIPVLSFTEQSPHESVNMFGMKYEYAEGSHALFNVQQTFRFLATDEWYSSFSGELNLDLKQQRGIEYSLGVQHNLNNTTIVTITPYWMNLTNEIFFNPESGFFGSNDNYDNTRRVGVEIGQKTDLLKVIEFDPLDELEIFTNYTYQDTVFRNGSNDGKRIPFVPSHQANVGMNLEFLDHFGASIIGRYVSSRFPINDTSNIMARIKPYFVVDGKLTYKRKNWEVFGALNNMFNEKYHNFVAKSATSTVQNFYPAAERNFSLGMTLQF